MRFFRVIDIRSNDGANIDGRGKVIYDGVQRELYPLFLWQRRRAQVL